jgi:dTDP-glucose 4,6-dehydratase/UDP-glucose 4-epimerase
VNTNFDSLFNNQPIDVCINASGSAHVGFSFEKPDKDFELNVLNVHKLLVAIRTFQPKCKFINFSSAAVYGNPEHLPIHESAVRNPLSPYGFHKLQSEYLLKEYNRFFQIPTCNVRVFSAYGPGLRKQLFWELFQKAVHSPNEIILYGTGNETRDFIYIDDLVYSIDLLITHAAFDGESYNIASGIETSIQQVAEVFFEQYDQSLTFSFNNMEKKGDPNNWVADIGALKQIGFLPKVNLRLGLAKTVDWLKTLG